MVGLNFTYCAFKIWQKMCFFTFENVNINVCFRCDDKKTPSNPIFFRSFRLVYIFSGQSMYEFEDQRLSRPRHLPSSLIPPSRSTSVPPGSTTDGRGEPNGAATSHHYHAPLPPREDHRRSASPAGSLIGEQQPPVMHPNPQIAQQQHHHPHRGGGAGGGGGPLAHPPRSMSPRYFRPPPGVGPPHFRGPGPPWGRGPRPPGFDPRFSPRGPPRRHPMGPRGPPGYHPGHRSRMPGMNIFVSDLLIISY